MDRAIHVTVKEDVRSWVILFGDIPLLHWVS